MKPEHLDEAVKLAASYKRALVEMAELEKAKSVLVEIGSKSIRFNESDVQFKTMRSSMIVMLEVRMQNMVRRSNQIGLALTNVVI